MNRLKCLSLIFLLAALVSGCGAVRLKIIPKFAPLPQTVKSPLNVGIYYSPQFVAQEHIRYTYAGLGKYHTWAVPIGEPSVLLFDDILHRVFEKRTPITRMTKEEVFSKGVDMVIAPSLEYFNFRLGGDEDSDWFSVCYRLTLYTKWVVPAESWVACGNATSNKWVGPETWIKDDMADAASQLQKQLEGELDKTISAIANLSEGKSNAPDSRYFELSAKHDDLAGIELEQLALLNKAGVVGIQVAVRSNSESQVVVRASDMRLQLKDGVLIEPLSIGSMLNILGPKEAAIGVSPVIVAIGYPMQFPMPFLKLFTVPFPRRLFQGSLAEFVTSEKAFKLAGQTLFLQQTISKRKEAVGTVFFHLPEGVMTTEGTILKVWLVDPVIMDGSQMEVLLPKAQ